MLHLGLTQTGAQMLTVLRLLQGACAKRAVCASSVRSRGDPPPSAAAATVVPYPWELPPSRYACSCGSVPDSALRRTDVRPALCQPDKSPQLPASICCVMYIRIVVKCCCASY